MNDEELPRLIPLLRSQRSWHAILFVAILAASFLTIVLGPPCTDACSWACGDCAVCAMAAELPTADALLSIGLVMIRTPEVASRPESIDPRPVESIPLPLSA